MQGGGKRESLDDARAKFKHHSLRQDYQELEKETKVARNRLRRVKDKKLTLEAEVSFLRRRYNFFLKSHAQSHQTNHDINLPQKLDLKVQSKKSSKAKKSATKGVAARSPVPKFESSQKQKAHNKKETAPLMQIPSLSIDLNQNASRNSVHQLDLNQIANDEDDFQPSVEPTKIEESAYFKGLTEEELNDMKLSACRNIGNSVTSRTGKRKISWQDQVALRV
ncbi:hypothetical protein QQ045_012802 [Rhodiola kirilowii]